MVETSLDRRALAEVYNVLIMLEASVFKKIPNDIIQAIKNNMDADYKVEWDKLQKGIMLEDTEKILAVIYTDYLATPEEKNVITQLEAVKAKNMYSIFKKRKK